MPAAAVIPAPIVHPNAVAVKKLVVEGSTDDTVEASERGFFTRFRGFSKEKRLFRLLLFVLFPPPFGGAKEGKKSVTVSKTTCSKQTLCQVIECH